MSNFTSKHFRKVAQLLGDLSTTTVTSGPGKMPWDAVHYFNLMESFCLLFEKENPNFNRRLFLKAAECPYFDEVRMGVPCEFRTCKECGENFVDPLDDDMSKICPRCERLWKGDR